MTKTYKQLEEEILKEFEGRFVLDSNRNPKSHTRLGSSGYSIGQTPSYEIKSFISQSLARVAKASVEDANSKIIPMLDKIIEGSGAFSRDPLTHAENTIDNMKELAQEARQETLNNLKTFMGEDLTDKKK